MGGYTSQEINVPNNMVVIKR